LNKRRHSGIAGFASTIFVFTCILISVASWNQFSWVNNALSDLGVQSGITAIIFNSGLIIGGLFFIIFATGLYNLAGTRVGKVGATVFVLACIMLMAIGFFNENFKPTHYIVSVGFFVLMPISLFILTADFWLQGRRKLGIFTLAIALLAASVWVLEFVFHYVSGVAIPEFVSSLAGAVWVSVMSYLMIE
jgi:hypothetical membrane protein